MVEIRAHCQSRHAVAAIKTTALLDERLGLTAVGLIARSLALAGKPLVPSGLTDDPVAVANAIEQLRAAGYLVGTGQTLHLVDTPMPTAVITAAPADPQTRREQMHIVPTTPRVEVDIPDQVAQEGLARIRQALREAHERPHHRTAPGSEANGTR